MTGTINNSSSTPVSNNQSGRVGENRSLPTDLKTKTIYCILFGRRSILEQTCGPQPIYTLQLSITAGALVAAAVFIIVIVVAIVRQPLLSSSLYYILSFSIIIHVVCGCGELSINIMDRQPASQPTTLNDDLFKFFPKNISTFRKRENVDRKLEKMQLYKNKIYTNLK
ncbi:hypothetical protein HELRODRAFT_176754 [Helobdella robusta]|uniref:Uncharacterized protein n=1 Tax=Helobdella robusta TaxID=6412 RepID=T1FAV7_HELRO|nr:hypothetical protein HELRODRAFT_176754 [Helobdella robusta]ESN99586.1 hypothetical protein HELRODRAFT_176754 [Helobdella robusta]